MAQTSLIYGDSGTFKTSNSGYFARYVHRVTGKRIRYIGMDGGGCDPIRPLIRAGIIEPFFLLTGNSQDKPLPVIRRIAQGWWPDEMEDGIWVGKLLVDQGKTLRDEVGGYIIEGLTSDSDIVLEDLRSKHRSTAEQVVTPFEETVGGQKERFGMSCRGHYNFAQQEVLRHIRLFGNLPVSRVLFTAHEAKGEDEDTKAPIRGPGLAGKAKTDKVPKEVGECLHFEMQIETVNAKGPDGKLYTTLRPKVLAYFQAHPDPIYKKLTYPAKPRIPAQMIPKLLERWPAGFFVPGLEKGLDEFLEFEDELMTEATEQIKAVQEAA